MSTEPPPTIVLLDQVQEQLRGADTEGSTDASTDDG